MAGGRQYKGRTPAIFANEKSAYIILPQVQVPKGTWLVITCASLERLALAFCRSTTVGETYGERIPKSDSSYSFNTRIEIELYNVSKTLGPEGRRWLTINGFRILRHCLGSSHLSETTPDLGWRNHYADDETNPDVVDLLDLGLIERATAMTFRATRKGQIVAGAIVELGAPGVEVAP